MRTALPKISLPVGRPSQRIYTTAHASEKECSKCHEIKTRCEFYPDSRVPGKLSSRCKGCHNTECKNLLRSERLKALQHYGQAQTPYCRCCGEITYEFLSLDHINGNGGQHRRSCKAGSAFYRWLRMDGYPEGYQVLCYNCNTAKGHYGICPHRKYDDEVL